MTGVDAISPVRGGAPAGAELLAGGAPAGAELLAGGPPAGAELLAGGAPASEALRAPAALITLAVIAKAPVPGRVKTRLCPPFTPAEAAALAEAALRDTLAALARTPAARRVVVLDGAPGAWLPLGFEVLPQRGDGLAERLAHAFEDLGGPTLLVGMDTPQVTPALLSAGVAALGRADAVLGPARDGGYWAIGLRRPNARAFAGVPMSAADTGRRQRRRLRALGLRVAELPALRDVDRAGDVRAVARQAPGTGFAACALRFAP